MTVQQKAMIWDGVGGALLLVLLFVGLLIAITLVSGSKLKKLFHFLHEGARREFTSKPGWVSLATFVVVAAMCFAFLLVQEVKSFLVVAFHLREVKEWFTLPLALGTPVLALICNFLFIALMRRK